MNSNVSWLDCISIYSMGLNIVGWIFGNSNPLNLEVIIKNFVKY